MTPRCSQHSSLDLSCWCRSVNERLLGARLVFQRASMARALSFEYLNRQLVWQVSMTFACYQSGLCHAPLLQGRVQDNHVFEEVSTPRTARIQTV